MDRLCRETLAHHDWLFVEYVLAGILLIREGFRVGVNPASVSLRSARQNMPSASLQPSVIENYLQNELVTGGRPILHFTFTQSSHQPLWRYLQETPAE